MRVGHEFVEVRAALVHYLALLEEQIHQHGLAATHLAMDVEATRRGVLLVAEQAAEEALLARRPVARQLLVERSERLHRARLGRVGFNGSGGHKGLVTGTKRGGRGSIHKLLTAPARAKMQAGNAAASNPYALSA